MTDSGNEKMPPFSQVVDQRVRNRQIDTLEFAIEFERHSAMWNLWSLYRIWFDYFLDEPKLAQYPAPAYTDEEARLLIVAVNAMNRFWDAWCETPSDFTEAEGRTLPEWVALEVASKEAFAEMSKRGRLPEYDDYEKTPAYLQVMDRRKRNLEMRMLGAVIDFESMSATWNLDRLHNWWFQSHQQEPELAHYPAPAYTEDEAKLLMPAVAAMHRFWEAWCAMPANTAEAQGRALPEWAALEVAAKEALIEMTKRGRISEDGP